MTLVARAVLLSFISLSIFAAERTVDSAGALKNAQPLGLASGIVYDAGEFPRDGKQHSIEFRFMTPSGRDLVAQTFTTAVRPHGRMPLLVLLREPDLQDQVFRLPSVVVEIRIDGQAPARRLLTDLESLDPVGREHVLNSMQREHLFSAPAGTDASLQAGTASLRLRPAPLFQCPQSDWGYCEEEFTACDSTCDPYDPYNNCQACRDNYNYCVNGQPEGQPVTEDTLVSYTTSSYFYCDTNGSGAYSSRNEHRHHVEYQYYWCKESGQYSDVVSNYYYDRTCFHWWDYDCTFTVGYFDAHEFCSY